VHSRHRGPSEGMDTQCTVDIEVPVRNKHTVYSRQRDCGEGRSEYK